MDRKLQQTFICRDVVIVVLLDDLVLQDTDAIVCPANSYGHMRGGAAQTIRLRGGDEIQTEAQALAPIRIGQAVTTTAGALRARRVFHAPTMVEPVEVAKASSVAAAMKASLDLAWKERIRSISFPGMGTGTGGLPYAEAPVVMVRAIREAIDRPHTLRRIHLVATSEDLHRTFLTAAESEFSRI